MNVLLRGGHIYSPADPFATAMLVVDGRVAWLGEDTAADVHRDAADVVVNLDGSLVTPAFVDAHVHATSTGLLLTGVDLTDCPTMADALDRLAVRARDGGVVLGHGWDETRWPEGRPPTRAEIDRAADGARVYLTRIDVHSALVSSALVETVPQVRGEPGYSPDGPLTREAHHVVRVASLGSIGPTQRRSAQAAALERAARVGIASVHECAGPTISGADDLADLLALAAEAGGTGVVGYWGELGGVDTAMALGARGAAGDLFVDGALGSRTACLREAYLDDPGNTGAAYLEPAAIAEHFVTCTRAGLQGGFHVIGDAAVDAVVVGLAQAADVVGSMAMRAARHRLEHVEMLDPAHLTLLADLGVVASVQPAFDAAWGGATGMYATRLGAARAATLNPLAAMSAAGVSLAFGSDAPVTPLDPWGSVRAAAFHRTPEQRVSVRAAFAAHTRGGRRAADEERDQPGVLVPGAPATYAIWAPTELVVQAPDDRIAAWSTDPRSGTPGLPDLTPDRELPTCWRTVIDGRTVHDVGALGEVPATGGGGQP